MSQHESSDTLQLLRGADERLSALLSANASVDWRAVDLDHTETQRALDLSGLAPDTAVALLKAYQRILRILPASEDRRALPLLASGLHSAIQIASTPEHQFARHWAALFPGEETLGVNVYRAALQRRSELLHRHIDQIQRNEPHYQAARFK